MARNSRRKSDSSASRRGEGSSNPRVAKLGSERSKRASTERGKQRKPSSRKGDLKKGASKRASSVRQANIDDSPSFRSRTIASINRAKEDSASLGRTNPPSRQLVAQRNRERTQARSPRSLDRTEGGRQRGASAESPNNRIKLSYVVAIVAAALAIIAAVIYVTFINTNIFEIREIEFEGTDHLTTNEVAALVSVPQGTTLINVNSDAIAASLKRDAWIKSVDVRREFPDKLVISVTERTIGAIVEVPIGQRQNIQDWAISEDGMWLMAIPSRDSDVGSKLSEQIYEDAESVLHITDVPYGIDPQIGSYTSDGSVQSALNIIFDMTTKLADQVSSVAAPDVDSIMLTLDSGIEIAFGDDSNVRDKERICLQIMEDNPSVVYINVRVPDRPTWRYAQR